MRAKKQAAPFRAADVFRAAATLRTASALHCRVRYAALAANPDFPVLNWCADRMKSIGRYVVNRADWRTRTCFGVLAMSETRQMPRYTFKLRDDDNGVEDDFVILPNAEIAHSYACDVVRELMDHRERSTRHWRLDVYQDNSEKVFEIPFSALDHTLDHLRPDYRAAVVQVAQ